MSVAEGQTVCEICEKPFQHYTKTQRVRGQEPLVELRLITCHPGCTKINNKILKIKERIMKAKKVLHNLRTTQLNMEFELFMAGQPSIEQETDEIFVIVDATPTQNSSTPTTTPNVLKSYLGKCR